MFTLTGDFGKAIFQGGRDRSGRFKTRYLSIDLGGTMQFFKRISVLKTNIMQNAIGLYSFATDVRDNKMHFASLTTPKHLFQSKKSGCAWKSKGRLNINTDSFDMCAIEYMGQQCPDEFLGTCLEKIFGAGNDAKNMLKTAEGRALFNQFVSKIYEGLGNSFYDLAHYGQHPLIDEADKYEWYTVSDKEWYDYTDQQKSCGGLITALDQLKLDGHENYNCTISDGDVNISNGNCLYTGEVHDLFDMQLAKQTVEMSRMSKYGSNNGYERAVFLVTRNIFTKFEQELSEKFDTIPDMFYYHFNGKFCASVGCDSTTPVQGVLRYKGHLVICMDEWDDFANMLGVKIFRSVLMCVGNFGIGFDIPALPAQYGGMGMKITQRLDDPYKGMTFMSTCFKVGTGIIAPEFGNMASAIYTPNNGLN